MKTAQYIARQCTDFKKPFPDLIELIKEYGKDVARQALLDASVNLTDCHSSLSAWKSNKSEILETEIKTP